jgi:hypothetical protein
LGKIDAPFFGIPRKEKLEKSGEGAPFFATPSAEFVGCMWSLSTGLSS